MVMLAGVVLVGGDHCTLEICYRGQFVEVYPQFRMGLEQLRLIRWRPQQSHGRMCSEELTHWGVQCRVKFC